MSEDGNGPWSHVQRLGGCVRQHVDRLHAALEQQKCQAVSQVNSTLQKAVGDLMQQHRKRSGVASCRPPLPFASVSAASSPPDVTPAHEQEEGVQEAQPKDLGEGKERSDERRKEPTPEEREALRKHIEGMSQEDREKLLNWAQRRLLKDIRIKYKGKKMDYWQFKDEAVRHQAAHDANLEEYKKRGIPPVYRKDEVSSLDVRQGMEKPQLFPEEEASLGLRKMAMGVVWSPFPWKWLGRQLLNVDFAYGIYAWPEKVAQHLREPWVGQKPSTVLQEPLFYEHALAVAPNIQVTLMAVPMKNIPVKRTCNMLLGEVRSRLEKLDGGITEKDERTLERMEHSFSAWTLQPTGLIQNNCYAEGSSFFFTTLPNGNLAAEATTPGVIRDQKAVQIAVFDNPRVTYAVMDMVLGDKPLDPNAKLTAGNNLLFAANGFSFDKVQTPANWVADYDEDYTEFKSEEIEPAAANWEFDVRSRKSLFRPLRTKKVTAQSSAS